MLACSVAQQLEAGQTSSWRLVNASLGLHTPSHVHTSMPVSSVAVLLGVPPAIAYRTFSAAGCW